MLLMTFETHYEKITNESGATKIAMERLDERLDEAFFLIVCCGINSWQQLNSIMFFRTYF